MIRTYSELLEYPTFLARYRYLRLRGEVGYVTFGHDRYLNQALYRSREWKRLRHEIIVRDEGCDLGIPGYEIHDAIYVHHMNPITPQTVIQHEEAWLFNPEYLITTTHNTHNAIHYGDEGLLPKPYVPRRPGDTKLW